MRITVALPQAPKWLRPPISQDFCRTQDSGLCRTAAPCAPHRWNAPLSLFGEDLERNLVSAITEFEEELFRLGRPLRHHRRRHDVRLHAYPARGAAESPRLGAALHAIALESGLAARCASRCTLMPVRVASGARCASAALNFRNLSLVDESVMDEGAVLYAIASRQESRANLILHLLGQRFGVLAAAPAFDSERIPLGPQALCRAVRHATEVHATRSRRPPAVLSHLRSSGDGAVPERCSKSWTRLLARGRHPARPERMCRCGRAYRQRGQRRAIVRRQRRYECLPIRPRCRSRESPRSGAACAGRPRCPGHRQCLAARSPRSRSWRGGFAPGRCCHVGRTWRASAAGGMPVHGSGAPARARAAAGHADHGQWRTRVMYGHGPGRSSHQGGHASGSVPHIRAAAHQRQ